MGGSDSKRRLIAGGIVVAVALVVGFLVLRGDGRLSEEDFVSKADAICETVQQEFDQIQRTAPRTADEAEKQAEALVSISSDGLDRLRDLDPPSDLSATYGRYLAARERALGYIEEGRDAAAANDPKGYAAAKRKAADDQATRLQLARSLRLKTCSRPSVTLGGGAAQ